MSLTTNPVRVSPAGPTDDEEVEALRLILRDDAPYSDEPPVLDDIYYPSDDDSAWWAAVRLADPLADADAPSWPDVDLEPLPEVTVSGGWDLPNGQFGYTREEP